MSTRSGRCHCFGLGVVGVSRTEFGGGETAFHCRTPASRLRCACCHGSAAGKGHRYVSVVLDPDTGAAIHVAEGKAAASVGPFLRRLKRSGARIEAVATDMGDAVASLQEPGESRSPAELDRGVHQQGADHEAAGLRIQEHGLVHAQA